LLAADTSVTLVKAKGVPGTLARSVLERLLRLDMLRGSAEPGGFVSPHRVYAAFVRQQLDAQLIRRRVIMYGIELLVFAIEARWVEPCLSEVPWAEVIALHDLSERLAPEGRSTARTAARTAIRRVIPSLPAPAEAIQAQALVIARSVGRQVS
jgi:hypothetical protein